MERNKLGNPEKNGAKSRRMANWLTEKSERLPLAVKKLMFYFMVVAVSGYCLIIMFGDFNNGFTISPITDMKLLHQAEVERLTNKVQMLERHLDSLSMTETGRLEKDSILKANPGLSDSIGSWKKQIEVLKLKLK